MYVCTVLQCRTVIREVSSFQECPYRGVPLYSITICVLMYILHTVLQCTGRSSEARRPNFGGGWNRPTGLYTGKVIRSLVDMYSLIVTSVTMTAPYDMIVLPNISSSYTE